MQILDYTGVAIVPFRTMVGAPSWDGGLQIGVEDSGSSWGDWNLKKHLHFDHEEMKFEDDVAAVVDGGETIHYYSGHLPPASLPPGPEPSASSSPWLT